MKLTDVYIVADLSSSMSGHLAQTQEKLVWDMVQTLAKDPLPYRISIIGFASQVREPTKLTFANQVTQLDVSRALNPVYGNTALRAAIVKGLSLAEQATHDGLTAEAALVQVFSDGEENHSYGVHVRDLEAAIGRANASGRVTLAFAGPASAGQWMEAIGIPAGNFRPWDGSAAEQVEVARETVTALQTYSKERAAGKTRSVSYYVDPSKLNTAGVRSMAKKVTPSEVKTVSKRMDGRAIADFFTKFEKGQHYYQLIKPEYIDQDKDLVVHIKDKDEYRQGSRSVRILLGLPEDGRIRVKPSPAASNFDVFIQSASVNRKLVEGQKLLTL